MHTLLNPLYLSHLSLSTHRSYFAAMVTGWNIFESWRDAVSTASGTRRFAPSIGWWTSTELTASPWTKRCISETLPHQLTWCPTLHVTPIPTLTKAALRSPCSQPASTLTPLSQREAPPHVCWNQLWGYDSVTIPLSQLVLLLNTHLFVWRHGPAPSLCRNPVWLMPSVTTPPLRPLTSTSCAVTSLICLTALVRWPGEGAVEAE